MYSSYIHTIFKVSSHYKKLPAIESSGKSAVPVGLQLIYLYIVHTYLLFSCVIWFSRIHYENNYAPMSSITRYSTSLNTHLINTLACFKLFIREQLLTLFTIIAELAKK